MACPEASRVVQADCLYAEGRSAAARALHIRILELEAGRFEGFDVVDYAAVQVHQRGRVDKNLEAVVGEDLVHHAALVFEGHGVLKSGKTAANDTNAQT